MILAAKQFWAFIFSLMEDMSLWGCLLENCIYRISSKLLRKWYFPFKSLPVFSWNSWNVQTDPSETTLIWQDLCNFCRDSKRHLSSTGLSPGQITHPCFKVCKCASSLANYLQALITWPNQFISPSLIFFRQPNLSIWTFKEKEISCRQAHDMENFSSNS